MVNVKSTDIIYKYTVLSPDKPDKVYLGTTEGDFKKRFYNHRKSFNNEGSSTDTTVSKYIRELKETSNSSPTLAWSIAEKVPPYSNISKKCLLCLHQKLEIINYPRPEELLNKRSELISRCRHANNFYCAIIKQSIDCNPLIGKQQWIRFYAGMFVITSFIFVKIVKCMKLKVANKLL